MATGGGGREGEEDAKGAGDAFAAAKAKPDWKDVAENGSDCGDDGEVVVVGCDVLGNLDGEEGFAAIEEEGCDAESLGAGAGDVGRADVAAASGADVLLEEDFNEEIAEGDGSQEICERNGDEPGVHGRLDEFSKVDEFAVWDLPA